MEFLRQTCNNILKSSLRQGLSEPESIGDLVYKLKKLVGSYFLIIRRSVITFMRPWKIFYGYWPITSKTGNGVKEK